MGERNDDQYDNDNDQLHYLWDALRKLAAKKQQDFLILNYDTFSVRQI